MTGRPVGVTLERDTNDLSRCLTLSYAEVPPPYAGGFVNSRIIIEGEPSSGDTDMSGTDCGLDGHAAMPFMSETRRKAIQSGEGEVQR